MSSVGCNCKPISYNYETSNHFSTGVPWAIRNYANSYRVQLLQWFIRSQYEI